MCNNIAKHLPKRLSILTDLFVIATMWITIMFPFLMLTLVLFCITTNKTIKN